MLNASLMVAVWIARQQTYTAAATTRRYRLAAQPGKLELMMSTRGLGILPAAVSATYLLISPGIAMRTAKRKIAPMIAAPMIDARTARGASRRGFLVSSARVLAVSKP